MIVEAVDEQYLEPGFVVEAAGQFEPGKACAYNCDFHVVCGDADAQKYTKLSINTETIKI